MGRPNPAPLFFAGDDTVMSLDEVIDIADIEAFFRRWGWCAKLRVVKRQGFDYIEFIGERALTHDGQPVFVGDAGRLHRSQDVSKLEIIDATVRLVSAPPIRRLLLDKSWITSDMPDEEVGPTTYLYALRLMSAFNMCAPMYAFANAMRMDHEASRGGKINDKALRELQYAAGVDPKDGNPWRELEIPNLDDSAGAIWRTWCEVTAGQCDDLEYAVMCGLTTLNLHGRDLTNLIPASWTA